ncbi:RNA pyrophosphohydrolase [Porphyrobacter algicida]|uniref:RNA pyrophosphohydrolase n=1 Tax=Qipengyuania algicida TaxID=1836209 RepID=A0A845AIH7_9SPHN|nr:RNA pyrophosphohydrolase [Qipengyuania algicida]MXP28983.1 RNA pyrophosphohydrolase [Qipengyuania algicida]
MKELGYRPCVGIMLVNADGQVFVGRRIDNKEGDWWQMPQGGVDKGEDLREAMYRELGEETGIVPGKVSIIGQMDEPIRYDLPDELIGKLWNGKYRGQEQVWFCVRFNGTDKDVDLEAHNPPEFCDWKWVAPDQLPELIVPFKKRVYRSVVEAFTALI